MITPDEIPGIVARLAELGVMVAAAARKDPDGVVRIDHDERRKIGKALVKLGRVVIRDAID